MATAGQRRRIKGGISMARMMKALVKAKPEVGLWLRDVPVPDYGINDVLIKDRKDRHLRHRCAHLPVGCLVPEDHSGTHGDRP
jgi:hypothetical protein